MIRNVNLEMRSWTKELCSFHMVKKHGTQRIWCIQTRYNGIAWYYKTKKSWLLYTKFLHSTKDHYFLFCYPNLLGFVSDRQFYQNFAWREKAGHCRKRVNSLQKKFIHFKQTWESSQVMSKSSSKEEKSKQSLSTGHSDNIQKSLNLTKFLTKIITLEIEATVQWLFSDSHCNDDLNTL